LGPVERVLDISVLVTRDSYRPVVVERSHEAQASFLHHSTRPDVDGHRVGCHAFDTQLGEALTDKRL
jgi:hypothetical protein